jgi:hypothetical protein
MERHDRIERKREQIAELVRSEIAPHVSTSCRSADGPVYGTVEFIS